MRTTFHNRIEAGQLLAEKLAGYADRSDVLVLGLPRGGVPVAAQVAKKLNAPLDIFVVRKLGLPGQPELAMGAIASGGIRVLNSEVIDAVGIPRQIIEAVTVHEQRELRRREQAYRDNLPTPDVRGKSVILVDDGVATGSTMTAAIKALRLLRASRVIVATPTIARDTCTKIRGAADDLIWVIAPEDFHGVGEWYEDFSQTTDAEVREILAQAHNEPVAQ